MKKNENLVLTIAGIVAFVPFSSLSLTWAGASSINETGPACQVEAGKPGSSLNHLQTNLPVILSRLGTDGVAATSCNDLPYPEHVDWNAYILSVEGVPDLTFNCKGPFGAIEQAKEKARVLLSQMKANALHELSKSKGSESEGQLIKVLNTVGYMEQEIKVLMANWCAVKTGTLESLVVKPEANKAATQFRNEGRLVAVRLGSTIDFDPIEFKKLSSSEQILLILKESLNGMVPLDETHDPAIDAVMELVSKYSQGKASIQDFGKVLELGSVLKSTTRSHLKCAGLSIKNLFIDAGYDTRILNEVGFSEYELSQVMDRFQFSNLKEAGYDASALRHYKFSAERLKENGFSAKELEAAGFNVLELKKGGFSITELKNSDIDPSYIAQAGYSVAELRSVGISAQDLKSSTFLKPCDLYRGGYSLAELREAYGLDVQEARDECRVYDAKTFRDAGYTASELARASGWGRVTWGGSTWNVRELRVAGYSPTDLKIASFGADQLILGGFSPEEVKAIDSVQELGYRYGPKSYFDAQVSLPELKKLGFTLKEMRADGFSDQDLKVAGFTVVEMKASGCDSARLKAAGFELNQIVPLFSCHELKDGGFTLRERRGCHK